MVVEFIRRSHLADASQKHHAYPVRNEFHHTQVMGDKQVSQPVFLLQILQQV